MLVRQRQPRLRTDLQHPAHLVEQRLVLDRAAGLEHLDVVRRHVDLLRQLRLRQLVPLLRAPVLDRLGNLIVHLHGRDDVVGPIYFREALAFGTLVGLLEGDGG